MNTSKYFKGNIHAFFMITIVTNTAWCHKTIKTFFSVFLKICSPAGAVNIRSVVISIALFCCFPFFTGCEKNLPNFKHLFKWNLSGVCCYVTNAGLSPSVRATEKSIEKIPQSTWFNLCCTGGTLTDVLLLAGRIMSHILCKILEKYFEILWILKTNFTFLISRNCYPVIVSIQYLKKTTLPYCKHIYKTKLCILKTYNYFHNILRRFYVLPNFPFTASENMRDYYL